MYIMKENIISITISKSTSEVFQFTIDPKNTSRWINGIEKEETNEWPVKIGSIYRNVDTSGKWTEYTVVKLDENKVFELASKEGGYHVKYTYISVTENTCELEYFEWVDGGELISPLSQDTLGKLKEVIESKGEER